MNHINIVILSLGILGLIFGFLPIVFALKLKKYVNRELSAPAENYIPRVSVILPCKGIDPGFDLNIKAFLNQDFPTYELLFVTSTEEDPAYRELKRICDGISNVRTRILVAGIAENRGQKLNNLIKGVDEASADTEVFAFVDSDTRPHKDFLRYLIGPLSRPTIGATTGFRWYIPEKRSFGSIMRSTWNGGGLTFLVDYKHNYAWGGAMAVKKSTFDRGEIKKSWENALSDDFTLTQCIKNLGLQIHFVPQCLVVSYEDSTLRETIEWTNRQQTIARVYAPSFWWSVTITHTTANLLFTFAIVILLYSIIRVIQIPLGAILILFLIPLEILNVFILLPTVKQLIPQHINTLDDLKWYYALLSPMASLLTVINALRSMTCRRIRWRGVSYEMRSSHETVVMKDK